MTANLLMVTIPALLGALGTVISAYIAAKLRRVEQQTNGRLSHVENELRLTRALLAGERGELGAERLRPGGIAPAPR